MNFYDYKVNSDYGTRIDPFTKKTTTHNGIDYGLPLNTEVLANVSGTVTKSTYEEGFGNYVVVKDGTGKLHYYAHLNKSSVNVGDSINVNDVLGLSGSTGRSTGAHLHYEVRENGKSIDPEPYTSSNSSGFIKPNIVSPGSIFPDYEDVKNNSSNSSNSSATKEEIIQGWIDNPIKSEEFQENMNSFDATYNLGNPDNPNKVANQISLKDRLKNIVFNIFKFIIIALIIVLFVIFVTKAMDINII